MYSDILTSSQAIWYFTDEFYTW